MQINRPVIKDYWDEDNNFKWGIYTEKLESYCDYLEKCLKEKEEFIDKLTSDEAEQEESSPAQLVRDHNAAYAKLKSLKEELDRGLENVI